MTLGKDDESPPTEYSGLACCPPPRPSQEEALNLRPKLIESRRANVKESRRPSGAAWREPMIGGREGVKGLAGDAEKAEEGSGPSSTTSDREPEVAVLFVERVDVMEEAR